MPGEDENFTNVFNNAIQPVDVRKFSQVGGAAEYVAAEVLVSYFARYFFKVEKIKSLAVAHPVAADSWTLSRNKEGEDMALAEAKPEEKLDSSKGNTAGRVLGYPSFDDVASKSAKPEDIGMDKAVTATIDTFEGYQYVVKMAKKDDVICERSLMGIGFSPSGFGH